MLRASTNLGAFLCNKEKWEGENPRQGSSRAKRAHIGARDDYPEGVKSAAMNNPSLTAISECML